MERFIAKLKEIHYKGPLCIEREVHGQSGTGARYPDGGGAAAEAGRLSGWRGKSSF